ncbi:CPCC family cysteine-rich protein [Micromonospora cathayae]|uniref:CPCC family cysteine-rich protein n=1 Tax=Micromonospora cathayae TaxID=3028804 RepID=A0ABY7ZSD3_9ACTN|nr:CPCC family cysteine-rich protein [Micromonospora sp. HUAS 3]WDZ84854.1 CPCC family cysteine-rich protein [Micromonospora sp. HUAS 3]
MTSPDEGAFVNVSRGPEEGPYACPCCGYLTLGERGGYEICDVCFWEDDGQDDHDAARVRGGPNRNLSLLDARRNFARCGASDPKDLRHVRPPRPDEHP